MNLPLDDAFYYTVSQSVKVVPDTQLQNGEI